MQNCKEIVPYNIKNFGSLRIILADSCNLTNLILLLMILYFRACIYLESSFTYMSHVFVHFTCICMSLVGDIATALL